MDRMFVHGDKKEAGWSETGRSNSRGFAWKRSSIGARKTRLKLLGEWGTREARRDRKEGRKEGRKERRNGKIACTAIFSPRSSHDRNSRKRRPRCESNYGERRDIDALLDNIVALYRLISRTELPGRLIVIRGRSNKRVRYRPVVAGNPDPDLSPPRGR